MRSDAREVVVKYLFSTLFTEKDDALFSALIKDAKLSVDDKQFAERLCQAVFSNYIEFEDVIARLAIGFKKDRIYKVDKCIMIVAMCEMKFFDDIPNVVSINEAVNIASKYSTESSVAFVNGILGKFNEEISK